jgi:hypothetical protein
MRHAIRASVMGAMLAALVIAPSASANKPIREVFPSPPDRLITGQCAFPVRGHIEGPEINTTFTDKNGNPIRLLGVFPGNTLTLTNLASGKSITLPATGSFQLRAHPDGTAAVKVTGHGAWPDGNPVTGEPGIWYQNGQVSATLDADGNATSVKSSGTLVNLCPVLAA